jgi:hypothetical protein
MSSASGPIWFRVEFRVEFSAAFAALFSTTASPFLVVAAAAGFVTFLVAGGSRLRCFNPETLSCVG